MPKQRLRLVTDCDKCGAAYCWCATDTGSLYCEWCGDPATHILVGVNGTYSVPNGMRKLLCGNHAEYSELQGNEAVTINGNLDLVDRCLTD